MLCVLIVEDDFKAFEVCKRALINLGTGRIHYAESAESALDQLEKCSYDLILIDIALPGINGIELAKRIRRTPGCQLMQVVFLTGIGLEWELQAFRELHCYDYILKPITAKTLQKKLDLLLEGIEDQKKMTCQIAIPKQERKNVIFFSRNGAEYCIPADEVLYAEAVDGECVLHTAERERRLSGIFLKEAIVSLAEQNKDFVQCHRAFAVDASKIEKIVKQNYRNYDIYLKGLETPVSMSSRYQEAVQKRWKRGIER